MQILADRQYINAQRTPQQIQQVHDMYYTRLQYLSDAFAWARSDEDRDLIGAEIVYLTEMLRQLNRIRQIMEARIREAARRQAHRR